MKNAIIKFLLQRRFLWTRSIDGNRIIYSHLIFKGEYITYYGMDAGLEILIESLTKDL